MADLAFTWKEMESDFEDPDYTKNYLHANLADFTKHKKERHLENIWLLRLKDEQYWLIGRLHVDNNNTPPKINNIKRHWIRFDPKKSEFYSNPLEVQAALGETLIEISKRMFGGGKNGQGSSSLIKVEPFETIKLNKLLGAHKKVSFDEFVNKFKSGEISGTPFKKAKLNSSSTNTSPPQAVNEANSVQLVSVKVSDVNKDEHLITDSAHKANSNKLGLSENELDSELLSKKIPLEIFYALKLVSKKIDVEYKNKPGTDIDAIVKRRVGQSEFRSLLEAMHGAKCHLSQIDNRRLLIASHIVPWSKSTGEEKTDPDNGLLLAVNWDAVFDKGLIGFDDQGKVIFSEDLDEKTSDELGLDRGVRLREDILTLGRQKFLQRHRQDVFELWKKQTSL